jgi:hypothetical protein
VARLAEAGPTVLVREDLHSSVPTLLRLTTRLHPHSGRSSFVACHQAAGAGPWVVGSRKLFGRQRCMPGPKSGALAAIGQRGEGACPVARRWHRRRRCNRGRLYGRRGQSPILEERFSSLVGTGALVRDIDDAGWSALATTATEVPDVLESLAEPAGSVQNLSPGQGLSR